MLICPENISKWSIYLNSNEDKLIGISHADIVTLACKLKVSAIQLTDKLASPNSLYETAFCLRKITKDFGIPFIINDRLDIANAILADGLHIGQEDIPIAVANKLINDDMLLSVTCNNIDQVIESEKCLCDFIKIGPFYEENFEGKSIKNDESYQLLFEIKKISNLPIIGFGDFNKDNVKTALDEGINCISITPKGNNLEKIENNICEIKSVLENII
ncbi:MAG: thiamine phosphate synthase [Pseudomonadota bacterium]